MKTHYKDVKKHKTKVKIEFLQYKREKTVVEEIFEEVCFIYEESSSIYTHKLHRQTIYFT